MDDFVRDWSGRRLPFAMEKHGLRAYKRRNSFYIERDGHRVAYAEPVGGHFYVTDYRVPKGKSTDCSTIADVLDFLNEGA